MPRHYGRKTAEKSWAAPVKVVLHQWKQMLWNLGLMALGSVLCAIAINGILVPQRFLSGGFAGLMLILHYLFPWTPTGGLFFILNVPVFALGWKFVGKRFFLYSLAGMTIFSTALQYVRIHPPVSDPILSALLAGILTGIGAGIILRSMGSSGGTDILSVILMERLSIRLGTTILAFNTLILTAAAFLFSMEKALYTLIYMYITSRMVNLVVTGLSQRKAVTIISPQWEDISQRIMEEIHRGVTVMEGHGGFTGQKESILYTVITFRELARLKQVVRAIDPNAFVVIADTLEVMGYRVGNQPHW